jgi:hypothetical protein
MEVSNLAYLVAILLGVQVYVDPEESEWSGISGVKYRRRDCNWQGRRDCSIVEWNV